MPETEEHALERGREAFDRHAWVTAFEELSACDVERLLTAEDLERLGEAARWSRRFEQVLDAFERAAAAFESTGDRRSARALPQS